tara:strand:- start:66 stop:551 length:486 start_codon:yes stop_codon:yes gene_type:complete
MKQKLSCINLNRIVIGLACCFFIVSFISPVFSSNSLVDTKPFLKEYKAQAGVTALDNGILYKIIGRGSGSRSPGPYSRVLTHYEGRLISGQVFDSSYKRNEPSQFYLHQVIPGWTSILQEMKIGDKWEVVIPSDLAYGTRKVGPIPANSTLIFIIELLAIN